MKQYLLTYYLGNQFLSEIVDSKSLAELLGKSSITGARNFRAYRIMPAGVYPVRISGCVTSMTVTVLDNEGNTLDTANYYGTAR